MTYRYPADKKAHVHKVPFSLTSEMAWCAGKPGATYLFGCGLHFSTFTDAIAYATTPTTIGASA